METRNDRKYTKDHEWALQTAAGMQIGITAYAQSELGDIVYVDLPEIGAVVSAGESFMTVESVKAVSDIYAPISGEVVAVNEKLADNPELVNGEPFDEGWLAIVKPSSASEFDALLTPGDYAELVAEAAK